MQESCYYLAAIQNKFRKSDQDHYNNYMDSVEYAMLNTAKYCFVGRNSTTLKYLRCSFI